MMRLISIRKKSDWLILAGTISIPFRPAMAVAFLLIGVLTEKIIDKKRPLFSFEMNLISWSLTSFYLLHVLGMSYSENTSFGGLDLQIKASFLLIPLVISIIGQTSLDRKTLGGYWLFSALVSGSVCFIKSLPGYLNDPEIANITYAQFCFFSHPTYLSLFLSIGLFICMYEPFESDTARNPYLRFFTIFILLFYILLAQSRTGIAVTVLLLSVNLTVNLIKGKRSRLMDFIPVLLAFLSYTSMSYGSGNDRLNSLVNEISVGRDTSQVDTSKYSASDTRIRIWRSAGEASLQHLPHGTGTGDVRQVLLEKYREKGYDDLFLKSYNAHNQFLQSSLALGMAGLLLLCAVFLFPILHFLK
ncbi:MAG: O-antigen ligase family protein, partial [Bacteroidota bacterium]